MSLRTLKGKLKDLGLKRRNIPQSPSDRVVAAIFYELKGSGCTIGYKSLWKKLQKIYGLNIKRDVVLKILRIADPAGVEARKKKRLRRRKYSVKGPNALWHLDGDDKLKPFGFAIHGCIDGYSRKILWLEVAYSNNDPKIIAHYYLQTIKDLKFLPRVIRSDHGTENVMIESLQQALRFRHEDGQAGLKSFIKGTSTSNQRIESFWSQMRKSGVDWWISLFKDLRDQFLFDNSNPTHIECLRYCFGPVLKLELDTIRKDWNRHRIRNQKNRDVPAGKPDCLFFCSDKFGGEDVKIKIEPSKIDKLIDKFSTEPVLISHRFAKTVERLIPGVSHPIEATEALKLYITILELIDNHSSCINF